MIKKKYDLLILGGGVAGYYCGIHCSKGGLRVALVEKDKLGGTGFRWGSWPVKKILDNCKAMARTNPPSKVSMKDYQLNFLSIENKIEKELREKNIDLYFSDGKFVASHKYRVEGYLLEAKYIVIATGTSAKGLGNYPINHTSIISHKEAVALDQLPKDLIIIGGNVEGCEFASLFSQFAVRVSLIEKEDTILAEYDRDLIDILENHLKDHGVLLYTSKDVEKIACMKGGRVSVTMADGTKLEADKVLITGQRKANFPRGLDMLGIEFDREKIIVNENLETNIDNIFAIGDINGLMGMAHGAIHQAIGLAEYILFNQPIGIKYRAIPRAIFTMPEIAGVGQQEVELIEGGKKYKRGIANISDTWRGLSKGIKCGFIKVLADKDDKLLGIWMVGDEVSEYVGLLSIIINKKIRLSEIKSNLIIHPSISEGILQAILNIDTVEE